MTPDSSWIRGNRPRVKFSYQTVDPITGAKTLADPPRLVFRFTDDLNNETVYTLGTDAQLVHDAVGHFHVDVPLDSQLAKGKWFCRWEAKDGTGIVLAAAECVLETTSRYTNIRVI